MEYGRTAIARQCAYLPQQTATRFEMRVEDVVGLGRYPHLKRWGILSRDDHARVAWAIERVGLTAFRTRTLPTLSGGERRRVFLARPWPRNLRSCSWTNLPPPWTSAGIWSS